MAKDHQETNPITIKPDIVSHMAEQFSWVPLPSCSPPGCPFPIKSLALSADVSPRTIHFRALDKRPVSGPGRGPPSGNIVSHAPLSMGILQPRLQNGLPCLPPGNLPKPGIKHRSPALGVDSSPSEPSGKPGKQTRGYQR